MAVHGPDAIMRAMSCTFRYMLRQLLWPLLFAIIVIAGIVWMSQSLRFMDLVINRGLPTYTMFHLAFLVLPMYTSVFLPIILFGVVLFAYARMNQDSELVIWRACGKSPLSIAGPAIAAAILVMIVCYALNVYYMPAAYREFKDLQHTIRHNYSEIFVREGAFNQVGSGLTVYVRNRAANGELLGILVHDRRDPERPVTMMAERGALVRTESGPRVVMVKGNRQVLNESRGDLSILYFDRYTLDLANTSESSARRWRDPRERFLHELFTTTPSGPRAETDSKFRLKLLAEGHHRIASPLLALAFTLMALAAVLTGEFNRRGQSRRITLVSIAMVLVQAANIGLSHLAGGTSAVVPLMYVLPLGAIGISLWLLLQSGHRRGQPTARLASRA